MSDPHLMERDARKLFLERLPWYVNGTLARDERDWMERSARELPWAAAMLAREQELNRATEAGLASKAGDLGLDRLLALARETSPQASTATRTVASGATAAAKRQASSAGGSWLQRLARFLAQPQYAMATVAALVAQTAVIGWLAIAPPVDSDGYRSIGVAEMRTLRVTFVADASETRIRAALLAAGARVVGGPNQLGEYWIASSMKSLDEVKAALLGSGLAASIEVDLAGPRGQ